MCAQESLILVVATAYRLQYRTAEWFVFMKINQLWFTNLSLVCQSLLFFI